MGIYPKDSSDKRCLYFKYGRRESHQLGRVLYSSVVYTLEPTHFGDDYLIYLNMFW